MAFMPGLKNCSPCGGGGKVYPFGTSGTSGSMSNSFFNDPCVQGGPSSVFCSSCPTGCSPESFYQRAVGVRAGNCGCPDPVPLTCRPGQCGPAPRFQTILNHCYAPYCNRFCTKTYEQDQWRDNLFSSEKMAMDGWRYCFKSKPWIRPDRTQPWDGDHLEYRGTQVSSVQAPIFKDDIDIGLIGPSCATKELIPYKEAYNPADIENSCQPCQQYQDEFRRVKKNIANSPARNCENIRVMGNCNFGKRNQDTFCEDLDVLKMMNKDMQPAPCHLLDGIMNELGENPTLQLHTLAESMDRASGRFYPWDRGLARVCNPTLNSYLTARPFRCNTVYRCVEPVHSKYAGHIPGEQFIEGQRRGCSSRNALKYLTFKI